MLYVKTERLLLEAATHSVRTDVTPGNLCAHRKLTCCTNRLFCADRILTYAFMQPPKLPPSSEPKFPKLPRPQNRSKRLQTLAAAIALKAACVELDGRPRDPHQISELKSMIRDIHSLMRTCKVLPPLLLPFVTRALIVHSMTRSRALENCCAPPGDPGDPGDPGGAAGECGCGRSVMG